MGPERLLEILERKFSLLLLAELARRRGAKVVSLAHALGASRPAVRAALDDLAARGWVAPNPGYGHPLRPEVLLTAEGAGIAAACRELAERLGGDAGRRVATRKWALPVLLVLGGEQDARFSQVAARLPGLTDRALSLALRDLEQAGLVRRSVGEGRPPRVTYAATATGRALRDALEGLA